MSQTDWVYLNGEFLPASEARVSPFDRGFLFAQSVYEVTSVYAGQLIHRGIEPRRACDVAICRAVTDDSEVQQAITEIVDVLIPQ